MRTIRDKIVYIRFEGAINSRNSTMIMQDLQYIKDNDNARNYKGIFISIKDLQYDIDILKNLIKKLHLFSLKINMDIAIGDYDAHTYTHLGEYTANTCVKLFPDLLTAKVFFDPASFRFKLKVLIYDEDEENVEALALILSKYNHTVVYAKNLDDFRIKTKSEDITHTVSLAKYNLSREALKAAMPTMALSKKLISNLPVFIDNAVDNLTMLTNFNAEKISHEIKPFNTEIPGQAISAIMSFNGDFNGSFVLIFPKDLAFKTVEAMLGEKLSSINEVSDGIGEFCNIITGGTKTVLSQNNIKILFDLPKTNTNLINTKASLKEGSGIWINMKLEEQPFYMYISA